MFTLINIIKFVCLATKKLPIGETSILTLVERQTRYAVTKKLVEKKAEYANQAVLECMKPYPIKSILSKIERLDLLKRFKEDQENWQNA